jgi:chaperonin cofactor prefoldin
MTLQELKDALNELEDVSPDIEIKVFMSDGAVGELEDVYVESVSNNLRRALILFSAKDYNHVY